MLHQRVVSLERLPQERPQRVGDFLHALRARRREEAHEPRHRLREVLKADRERPHGVGEIARHFPVYARRCKRHARARTQNAGVAERAIFSGRPHVDDGDIVTVAPQVRRCRDADDAGADDGYFLRH
jgi:hypothetical protein